jgi:hypothetical protein
LFGKKREEVMEMGTELERCLLLFVSFDLWLRGGNTGSLNEENKGGEERRKEGNLARWPLSKTGLLADTS